MDKLKLEPAVIVSLVAAVIALVVSFGIDLSAEQTGAIMAVVVILAGLYTRSQVTPQTNVDAQVDAAVANAYGEINADDFAGNLPDEG